MNRLVQRFFLCLALLPLISIAAPQTVNAQSSFPQWVSPTALYRFRISNSDLGYFYTPSYQQGINAGYIYEGPFQDGASGIVGIYAGPAGYTPDPAAGLVPLYQWRVVEHGWRNHYYLSPYYSSTLGSNYYFNGIIGYVFPANENTHSYNVPGTAPTSVTLGKVSAWYSQDYGYWYGGGMIGSGYILETPLANRGYVNHGVVCSTPKAVTGTAPSSCQQCFPFHGYDVLFYPPNTPPPPPESSCDTTQAQSCFQSGGAWDSGSCSCNYNDPPPEDCPNARCTPVLQQLEQQQAPPETPPRN